MTSIFAVSGNTVTAEESYAILTESKPALFRFTNDNWFTVSHPKIASFTIQDDGNAFGYTETNVFFRQYTVPNTGTLRVQRFEIEDHYHYIIDGEPVYSFAEFSIRLANNISGGDTTL